MANPYTLLFGRAAGTANQAIQIFEATAELHYILRDVVLVNGDPAEQVVTLYLQTGSASHYLVSLSVPTSQTRHQELRQVLLPNDQLWGFSTASSWMIHATGYGLQPAVPPAPGAIVGF